MSSVKRRNCHKSIIHNHQLCLDKEASWIPSHTFQGNSHDQQFAKSFMFIKHEQVTIISTCTTCLYRCFSLALVFIYDWSIKLNDINLFLVSLSIVHFRYNPCVMIEIHRYRHMVVNRLEAKLPDVYTRIFKLISNTITKNQIKWRYKQNLRQQIHQKPLYSRRQDV